MAEHPILALKHSQYFFKQAVLEQVQPLECTSDF